MNRPEETDLDRALRDDGRKPAPFAGEIPLTHRGDRAVVAPGGPGAPGVVLVGFYDDRDRPITPARLTADEWDAFVAAGNAAFGRAPK